MQRLSPKIRSLQWGVLALVCCGLSAPLQAACTAVPDTDGAVTSCETADGYSVKAGGTLYEYDKREFQERLRALLTVWAERTELGANALRNTRLDFWLSVPDTSPESTAARLVVTGRGFKFSCSMPLDSAEWRIDDSSVAVIEGEYPDDYGFKAAQILVQKHSAVSAEEFPRRMEAAFQLRAEPFSGDWYLARVAPLSEKRWLESLRPDAHSQMLVSNALTNQVIEWMGYRSRAFTFWYHD